MKRAALFMVLVQIILAAGCMKHGTQSPLHRNKRPADKKFLQQEKSKLKGPEALAGAPPFPGDRVSLGELLRQLDKEIEQAKKFQNMKNEFAAFARRHNPDAADQALYSEYAAVKVLFEATRDAGLWSIRWDITNREPDSKDIWRQWSKAAPRGALERGTAIAECDEISALFSLLAHRLGVARAGLFWPQWNHTVAVWTIRDAGGKDVRIVVPTTHIFLDFDDRFDHIDNPEFDPFSQKHITTYDFRDVDDSFTIPADLANFFIAQIRIYMPAPEQTLHYLSYQRRAYTENPGARAQVIGEVEAALEETLHAHGAGPDAKALNAFLAQAE